MINEYAIDALNKHPLEPADWELPGCDCPLCGEPRNESDRVCSQCKAEARAVAVAIVLPALRYAFALVVVRRTVVAPREQPVPESSRPTDVYGFVVGGQLARFACVGLLAIVGAPA